MAPANLAVGGAHASKDEFDPVVMHGQKMTEWLRAKGGFMSDKLEIRRRVPGDQHSPAGVFAVEDIDPEEIVLHIPRHLYLNVPADQVVNWSVNEESFETGDDYENDEDKDAYTEYIIAMENAEMDVYYANSCRLVHRLLNETKLYRTLPSDSEFAPYIAYLEETQQRGQLPAAYSSQGKALLRKIQGITDKQSTTNNDFWSPNFGKSPLPPLNLVDWIDENFVNRGCFNANDADAYHAAELIIQRGFDLELIPIWDMVNHEVAHRVNVDTNSLRSEEGLIVHARQHIRAGEELLYTYHYCTDCNSEGFWLGAPGIYRDFGFLEEYPQEWPFQDQEVYAQIWRDSVHPDRYNATFYTKADVAALEEWTANLLNVSNVCSPDAEDLIFFDQQLMRLQRLDLESELLTVPSEFEVMMIRQYYTALVIAISSVIDSVKEKPIVEGQGQGYMDRSNRVVQSVHENVLLHGSSGTRRLSYAETEL